MTRPAGPAPGRRSRGSRHCDRRRRSSEKPASHSGRIQTMSAICGIVGEGAAGGRGRRDVAIMLELLKPRGPDGAALHEQNEGGRPLAFGVRQLAAGKLRAQPNVGRGATPASFLVYDGQIFNAAEVRAFVSNAGRTLRGDDDGELFVHLYEMEGPAGLRRIDGQFAFAMWDAKRQALVLGRDFLGVRPLYYRASGGGVIFASEIKAILAVPDVAAEVDEVAVSHY